MKNIRKWLQSNGFTTKINELHYNYLIFKTSKLPFCININKNIDSKVKEIKKINFIKIFVNILFYKGCLILKTKLWN